MTKLKTLKELPCVRMEEFSCCSGNKQEHLDHIAERKLRGLEPVETWTDDRILRQEAIKWVKFYKKRLKSKEWMKNNPLDNNGRIEFIKNFFNITEAELQDEVREELK